MQRADYLMTIAFWTSVPLYAVALAVFWPHLGVPGVFVWAVVVTSSAFLTFRAFVPWPGEEELQRRQVDLGVGDVPRHPPTGHIVWRLCGVSLLAFSSSYARRTTKRPCSVQKNSARHRTAATPTSENTPSTHSGE